MKIIKYLRLLIFLINFLLLSGCVSDFPNITNLNVRLTKKNIGNERPIAITIIDQRPYIALDSLHKFIYFQKSYFYKFLIRNQINRILLAYNFRPVNDRSAHESKLIVKILSIHGGHNVAEDDFWKGSMWQMEVAIQCIAIRHNHYFKRNYYVLLSKYKELGLSIEKEDYYLNKALIMDLNKISKDQKLFQFLAK